MAAPVPPALHPELVAAGWAIAGQDDAGEWYFENDALDVTAYEDDLPPPGLLPAAPVEGEQQEPGAAPESAPEPAAPENAPDLADDASAAQTAGGDPKEGMVPPQKALPPLAPIAGVGPVGLAPLAVAGALGLGATLRAATASALPAIGAPPAMLAVAEEALDYFRPYSTKKIKPEPRTEMENKPIIGHCKMSSCKKIMKFVYLPDGLILGPTRDKMSAAKIFEYMQIDIPQQIFYLTSGDATQTWQIRQPGAFNFDMGGSAMAAAAAAAAAAANPGLATAPPEEKTREIRMAHWRHVMRQKLTRVLTGTAKSSLEAGAYFCVDASASDAIGQYLALGCTKENTILSIAHGLVGDQDADQPIGWCEGVMKAFADTEGNEDMDKELGVSVVFKKEGAEGLIELDDEWNGNDRLLYSVSELAARCAAMGVEEEFGGSEAYKYHPSTAPTHYFVCETLAGRRVVEELIYKTISGGEFIINGSYVSAARRVHSALNLERPLFVFQHTGGCADLTAVMLQQVTAIENLHKKIEADAIKSGVKDKGKKSLEDLMNENLPFDPFLSLDPMYVVDRPAQLGLPKIKFTGPVGNVYGGRQQPALIAQVNAIFANFPSSARAETRLLVDPFSMRGEALQDMISRTMSAGDSGNKDELNGDAADKKRLHLAWEMHGALNFAAQKQAKLAQNLQACVLILSFGTGAISQLRTSIEWFFPFLGEALAHQMADEQLQILADGGENITGVIPGVPASADASCDALPDSGLCQLTKYLSIIVPALVTVILTVQSYLDPDSQCIVLKSGAARIEAQIYMFRTRTGPYGKAPAVKDDDGDGKVDAPISSREKFGTTITGIWDGVLSSSVSDHSMPRRISGHDHRVAIREEFQAAQDMVAKYMPGELGEDADGDGVADMKALRSKATKMNPSGHESKLGFQLLVKYAPFLAKYAPFLAKAGVNKVMPTATPDDQAGAIETGAAPAEPEEDAPKKEPDDDSGLSPMRAEDYVKFRMLPKLIAMSRLSPEQAKQKSAFKMLSIGLAAGSTLLGALGINVPVPLIVQFASALAGWESYKQMNMSLKLTNSAVGKLERLVLWWQSLSMIEKRRPDRKDKLVMTTEDILSGSLVELAIAKQMESKEEEEPKKE
jgi:hypothetical protein